MREFFTQVKIRDWDGSASQKVVGVRGPFRGPCVLVSFFVFCVLMRVEIPLLALID